MPAALERLQTPDVAVILVQHRDREGAEARLIDDLLDVARIERGRLEIQRRRLDVHDVLQDAIGACAPNVAQRRVAIEPNFNARRDFV